MTDTPHVELFNVCQFFPDETYEYIQHDVTAEKAFEAFYRQIHKPAAIIGIITRVIITDRGDCINAEWKFGEGVVYPTREMLNK